MKKMRILVTGGAGYKGTKLVSALAGEVYNVTILDNFMYGYEPVLHLVQNKNINMVKGDVRNGIENLSQYDAVFHLAGISGYPACEANQSSAEQINVQATRKIVDALSKEQIFINASTTSFYGKSGAKCTEITPIDPVSMYGITKYLAEKIVQERENSISLRFATVFGPSPRMRMDLMVNDFTYKAKKERVLILFDSYAVRTFIHIDDAVECYLFSLHNYDSMKGQIFNAGGNGLNFSKKDIADAIAHYVDYKIIDSELKDKDVRHFIIDYNKIHSLGFSPKKSLNDGIEELIKLFSFYEYYTHYKTI